jgi:hypothetical protein
MRTAAIVLVAILLVVSFLPLSADTLKDEFSYVSPRPGAELVSREATLIFKPRGGTAALPDIVVTGKKSGPVAGGWVRSDDNNTLIFRPHRAFEPGEKVSVSVRGLDVSFGFTVSPKRTSLMEFVESCDCVLEESEAPGWNHDMHGPRPEPQNGFPFPSDMPEFNIVTNNNPDPRPVFYVNGYYLVILENDGTPVFLRNYGRAIINFQPQINGTFTFFQRRVQATGEPERLFVMDNTYTVIDEWAAGNGYNMDFHEFLFLPNSHALIMIYDPQTVDMSLIVTGGNPAATVTGLVIQEQDAGKNVVWQWRSWDHIPITDATPDLDLTLARIDPVHGNALDVDTDGNLLISSRNLDEITKVDYQNGAGTGDIIWRMGGKQGQNDFSMAQGGEWFSHQHDVRRLPNGNITVFDNGNLNHPIESRPVEYQLDENLMRVTQVWENRHDPALFGRVVGLHRRMPSGNAFVSWGNTRIVSEVRTSDGFVEWELELLDAFTYRAYRGDANAVAASPTLWVDVDDDDQEATLHFYKWGDTDVSDYVIYMDQSPEPTTQVGTSTGNSYDLTELEFGPVYNVRVTARDDMMVESPYSNEIEIQLDPTVPVLINVFVAEATDAGVRLGWDIVSDEEMQGFQVYRRNGDGGPETAVNASGLIPADQRSTTDRTALAGRSYEYTLVVVLDDGTEMRSPAASVQTDAGRLTLERNHPNPFNPMTTISYVLPEKSMVDLSIYDVRGALVKTLTRDVQPAGHNEVSWDGLDNHNQPVGSGIYFYKLTVGNQTLTRKMVLLK